MKNKNIILIIIIAALALGTGLFIRQQNISELNLGNRGHHEKNWYCPMHPWILYDHPGRCPICGMDLIKKINTIQQPASAVEGYITVPVTAQKQQLIGVRTAILSKEQMIKTIRATGEYEGEVYAQVFEDDLQFIKVGQKAIVEIPAYHQKYEVHVIRIHSSVDEATRTTRVHLWFPTADRLRDLNPNQRKFKFNMFVNVKFPVNLGEALIVPCQAVMDTGLRKIVFVQTKEGTFEPREIQTGIETDDGYEVISGLKEGERIVVSGTFLLDSESRVQAGLEGEGHGK